MGNSLFALSGEISFFVKMSVPFHRALPSLRGICKDVRRGGESAGPLFTTHHHHHLSHPSEQNETQTELSLVLERTSNKQAKQNETKCDQGSWRISQAQVMWSAAGTSANWISGRGPHHSQDLFIVESGGLLSFLPALLLSLRNLHSVSLQMPRAWDEFGAFP